MSKFKGGLDSVKRSLSEMSRTNANGSSHTALQITSDPSVTAIKSFGEREPLLLMDADEATSAQSSFNGTF